LYDETKEAVIIDCGCMYATEEKKLADFIAQNDLKIKRSLCTHHHFDHILGNNFVYQTYGIKPEAHQKEVELLPSLKQQIASMGFRLPVQLLDVEVFLKENEIIRFGESELETLFVPGHSPGSLAYYGRKDGFVVAGDVLFRGSIGRSDLWGGNQELLIDSIKNKFFPLPDKTIVYPGHGPATTVIKEKINNPFLS
jgi:glyoxylase-like metal-dependent hydrolase (beta-lactamase superfamily II)